MLTDFSGSGGTNHSSSSGGLYDTSSSSARFSSSSTLPSSSSIEAIPDDYSHSHPKTPYNIPIPPTPASQPAFSVRAAGRTFSFGRKVAQPSPPVVPTSRPESPEAESPSQAQASSNLTRRRALTESSYASASTATPPKLLDTDFDFGKSDDPDGFGNMFEGFGNRKSRILSGQSTLDGIETVGSVSGFKVYPRMALIIAVRNTHPRRALQKLQIPTLLNDCPLLHHLQSIQIVCRMWCLRHFPVKATTLATD